MVLEQVDSSNIDAAGYDSTSSKMLIRFKTGIYYEYLKVPEVIYNRFKEAQSKGSFFNQNIRNSYNCNRIDTL